MKIASLVTNGEETGDQILILSRKETQDMYNVYVEYCKQNPRMKKAKKVLEEFADNLQIW